MLLRVYDFICAVVSNLECILKFYYDEEEKFGSFSYSLSVILLKYTVILFTIHFVRFGCM